VNQYLPQQKLAVRGEDRATSALWVTYRWMTAGLATTGLVALFVASSPAILGALVSSPILFYGLMFAQLGLVVAFSAIAPRASSTTAIAMFFAYAALTGVTFSTIFLVYTAASIARVFFISAGAFAGLSVVGATTKRDLSVIGRFAIFALIGIIIASVVNMFVQSTGLDWLLSIGGVVVFAGLTAYDTQRLKAMFAEGVHGNMAIIGALTLYLDFINMFLFLLRLFGRRRD
jgi:FtsH-binding integral membrane protein